MTNKELRVDSIEKIDTNSDKCFDLTLRELGAVFFSHGQFSELDLTRNAYLYKLVILRNSGLFAENVKLPAKVYPTPQIADCLTDKLKFSQEFNGRRKGKITVPDTILLSEKDVTNSKFWDKHGENKWIVKPRFTRGVNRRFTRGWIVNSPKAESQKILHFMRLYGDVVAQPHIEGLSKYYATYSVKEGPRVGLWDEDSLILKEVKDKEMLALTERIFNIWGIFWFGFDIAFMQDKREHLLDVNVTTGGRRATHELLPHIRSSMESSIELLLNR